jgi:hypothetical protein
MYILFVQRENNVLQWAIKLNIVLATEETFGYKRPYTKCSISMPIANHGKITEISAPLTILALPL